MTVKINTEVIFKITDEEMKGLLKRGWIYWDPPGTFSHEMWDLVTSIIGENNYILLISSEGDFWKRGQFLLSPAGVENIKSYSLSTQ